MSGAIPHGSLNIPPVCVTVYNTSRIIQESPMFKFVIVTSFKNNYNIFLCCIIVCMLAVLYIDSALLYCNLYINLFSVYPNHNYIACKNDHVSYYYNI